MIQQRVALPLYLPILPYPSRYQNPPSCRFLQKAHTVILPLFNHFPKLNPCCGVSETPETSWPPIHQQFTFYVNSILRLAICLLVLHNIYLYQLTKNVLEPETERLPSLTKPLAPTRSGIEPETGPTI